METTCILCRADQESETDGGLSPHLCSECRTNATELSDGAGLEVEVNGETFLFRASGVINITALFRGSESIVVENWMEE